MSGKTKTPPTSVEVLPNGTRIEFWDKVDAEGNKQTRRYMVNGERFLSVTTALDLLAKEALIEWAARLAREGKDWRRERAEGGERGEIAHDLLHRLHTGKGGSLAGLSPAHRPYGQAGFKFVQKCKPVVLEVERMVASCEHRYAGRLDLFALIDGTTTLTDYKTVKKWHYKKDEDGNETDEKLPPYPENLLQLDLYQGARIQCGLEPAEQGLVVRLGPDADVQETFVDLDPERGIAILDAYRAKAKAQKALTRACKAQHVREDMDRQIAEAVAEVVG